MRIYFLTLFLFIFKYTLGQELNFGISTGLTIIPNHQKVSFDEEDANTLSATFGFMPKDKIFELCTEVRFVFGNYDNVKFPLYLNFIIGEKFKVCPSFGAFVCTNGNFGGLTGVSFEYNVGKKFNTSFRYEFFRERYEDSHPNHYGPPTTYYEARYAHWIGLGVTYNILKAK